jgi:hypothetical protein
MKIIVDDIYASSHGKEITPLTLTYIFDYNIAIFVSIVNNVNK